MHNFLSMILINYLGDFQFRQQVFIRFSSLISKKGNNFALKFN